MCHRQVGAERGNPKDLSFLSLGSWARDIRQPWEDWQISMFASRGRHWNPPTEGYLRDRTAADLICFLISEFRLSQWQAGLPSLQKSCRFRVLGEEQPRTMQEQCQVPVTTLVLPRTNLVSQVPVTRWFYRAPTL